VPTLARYIPNNLPQVHRLHIPAHIVTAVFPEPEPEAQAAEGSCEA
jgi:hypothetical protein